MQKIRQATWVIRRLIKGLELIFDGPETTRHVQRIRLQILKCNVGVNEAFYFSVAFLVGVTCNS
jgi:hypothetical protein